MTKAHGGGRTRPDLAKKGEGGEKKGGDESKWEETAIKRIVRAQESKGREISGGEEDSRKTNENPKVKGGAQGAAIFFWKTSGRGGRSEHHPKERRGPKMGEKTPLPRTQMNRKWPNKKGKKSRIVGSQTGSGEKKR